MAVSASSAPTTNDTTSLAGGTQSSHGSTCSRLMIQQNDKQRDAALDSLPLELQQELLRLQSLFAKGREAELAQAQLHSFDKVWEALSREASNRGGGGISGYAVAQLSRQLLALVEDYKQSHGGAQSHIVPNDASYNFVLHAFAVCHGGLMAAQSAEDLLREMLERCRQKHNDDISKRERSFGGRNTVVAHPTTKSFNIVINAWSKSGEEDAGIHAERVFTWMEQWRKECVEMDNVMFPPTVPSVRSVSGVMDAWAQVGGLEAMDRVQAILDVVLERYLASKQQDGPTESDPPTNVLTLIKPNVILFNSLIHAHVKGNHEDVYSTTEAAEKAEQILNRLESLATSGDIDPIDENDPDDIGMAPNTRTLSLLLHAWANVRSPEQSIQAHAMEKAEAVLRHMMELYQTSGYDVKPNLHSFSSMILAFARLRTAEGYRKAHALVDTMRILHKETDDEDMKPNSHIVNALIQSATNVSAGEAERVLKDTLSSGGDNDGCVDTTSFNLVIDAYAEEGSMNAALGILEMLEATEGRIKPDAFTYNTILKAMSKSSSGGHFGHEAEEILAKMESLYEAGNVKVKPTVVTYSSVITVWAKSMYQGRVRKSKAILDRLVERYNLNLDPKLKPDVAAFSSFISTCSNFHPSGEIRGEGRAVFRMAVEAFDMMKQYDKPNHFTYFTMMKTAERHAKSREECIRFTEALFQRACTAGQVSKQVLQAFQRNVPRQVQQQYQLHNGEKSMVPPDWCINVRKASKPLVVDELRR